jgi:hypothetical protein
LSTTQGEQCLLIASFSASFTFFSNFSFSPFSNPDWVVWSCFVSGDVSCFGVSGFGSCFVSDFGAGAGLVVPPCLPLLGVPPCLPLLGVPPVFCSTNILSYINPQAPPLTSSSTNNKRFVLSNDFLIKWFTSKGKSV